MKMILEYCSVPRSKKEISDYCDLRDLHNLTDIYLKPLIVSEQLAMTEPENPKSRNQKYYRIP